MVKEQIARIRLKEKTEIEQSVKNVVIPQTMKQIGAFIKQLIANKKVDNEIIQQNSVINQMEYDIEN